LTRGTVEEKENDCNFRPDENEFPGTRMDRPTNRVRCRIDRVEKEQSDKFLPKPNDLHDIMPIFVILTRLESSRIV